MDLLLSVALLTLLIVAVDVTLGADASGPASRLTVLFASPDQLGWPRGVQENYEKLAMNWSRAARPQVEVSSSAADEFEPAAPQIIEDGVAPVRVCRVR